MLGQRRSAEQQAAVCDAFCSKDGYVGTRDGDDGAGSRCRVCVVDGAEGEANKGKGTACRPMGPAGEPGGTVFCTPYSFMFLYSVENTGYNDVGSAVSLLSFPCSYYTELRDERGIRAESAGAHRSHRRGFLTECFGAFSVEVEVRADPRTTGREAANTGAGKGWRMEPAETSLRPRPAVGSEVETKLGTIPRARHVGLPWKAAATTKYCSMELT